jgi:hypothetical protein
MDLVRISPNGAKTVVQPGFSSGISTLWFDPTTSSFWTYALRGGSPGPEWEVRALPLSGGPYTTLLSNHLSYPSSLASTADSIFLANMGTVPPENLTDTLEQRPRSNPSQYTIFDSAPDPLNPRHPGHMDVDSTYIYWPELQTNKILRRRHAAGSPIELITQVQGNTVGLAVDGPTIYFSTYWQPTAQPPGRLFRVANQLGATAVQLASIPGTVQDVAVDANAIYVAGYDSGTVWKVAKPSACTPNPCMVDSCDPAVGTVHTPLPAGTSCSDGNACNGAETCDGSGTCRTGTPLAVDDGNACTVDACDPASGGITHVPVVCSGGDQCSVAACNPSTGCTITPNPNGTPCNDSNACTQTDSCQNGACTGTNSITCVARDACHTAGTCDTAAGVCTNPAVPPPCTAAQVDVDHAAHVIGGSVVASWSDLPATQRDDFVGLYASPTAGNYEYVNFHYICPNRPGAPAGPCSTSMSTGTMPLGIPITLAPGIYHMRVVSAAGATVATTQPFSIVDCSSPGTQCAKLDVTVSPGGASAGGAIAVQWSGDHAPKPQDFLGLYQVGTTNKWTPHNLRYTKGTAVGSMLYNLPDDLPIGPEYEIRLGSEDSYEPVARSVPFTVHACTTPGTGCAQLQVVGQGHPVHVFAGSAITVNWDGIGGPDTGEIVGLYPPGAILGNGYKTFHYTGGAANGTMKLNIPYDTVPGTFDVKLVQMGEWTTPLASDTVIVDPRPTDGNGVASVSVNATKPFPGGAVQVNWSGVGAPRTHDFVAIYAPGDSKWYPKSARYINGQAMGTATLDVPADLPIGRYEVRLNAEDSYEPIAIATGVNGFDVRACSNPGFDCASVAVAQTAAAAGRSLSVSWSGIQAPDPADIIAIYPTGADLIPLSATFAATGGADRGTLSLSLPSNLAPGEYEAKLLYAGGYFALLATSSPPFTVERDCVAAGGACPAIDGCHGTGVCSSATGVCSKPARPDNTACDDHDVCTLTDRCQAGRCTGTNPRMCTASDQCHLAGTCDPVAGCSNPAKLDGATCDDRNACTRTDMCHGGACGGAEIPGCSGKLTVEDLGLLDREPDFFSHDQISTAYGINDDGVAVGFSYDLSGQYRAVRWPRGGPMQRVGTDAQLTNSSVTAINNGGVIVGSHYNSGQAFRSSNGTDFEFFHAPAGPQYAGGMNDIGSFVGSTGAEAFRVVGTHEDLLGILPETSQTWGVAIDNGNNVVGDARNIEPPPTSFWDWGRAFRYIYADNRFEDLTKIYAPPGWILRTAHGITRDGNEIVGYAAHDQVVHAYRLTLSNKKVDDLGVVGAGISYAQAINANGVVAGSSNGNAFVYTEQLGHVNLNEVIDPSQDWVLSEATALNNVGDVVGFGFLHQSQGGNLRAFRLHVPGLSSSERIPRCTKGSDCASGHCSDGVCCDTDCIGSCVSCRLPGTFGKCTPRPNDTLCTDDNACTAVDICRDGQCIPGTAATCTALDECHVAGSCNTTSGACSLPAKPDGTLCSDDQGTCRSGFCTVSGAGVIRYQANSDPTTVDGYVSQQGDQLWQRGFSGTTTRGHATLDRGTPAWELDTTQGASPTGIPHEESWSITPVDQDLQLADAKGWTLRARLRLPTTGDLPGSGAAVYYNGRDRLFSMEFGTDASGHPIVNLRGSQHLTVTLGGNNTEYHDYVLKYEPLAGKAKLIVDGKPLLYDYVGFVNPNHPTVGFGDATISDGGHALYEVVEWTNCTTSSDGSACQLGVAYEPHIEYRSDPYPGLLDGYPTQPGKQTFSLNGLGNLNGKPVVDDKGIGWDDNNAGDTGHEEFWTLAPAPEDLSLAQQRGWTLSTRVRLPSTGDAVGPGVGVFYADGSKAWVLTFGTAANGDPIVGVEGPPGNIRSFTLDRQGTGNTEYHNYALRFDRTAGTADLFVDDVERISDYAGYASTQSARVVFGDLALGDSGHGQYSRVEWATCSAADLATCPADTGRIRYATDPDPRTQNGYVFGRTPQLWAQDPAAALPGAALVDQGSLVWDLATNGTTTWSITPTAAEIAVARMAGFALTARLSMQNAGDDPDTFFEYADGSTLWRMQLATDGNADPVVQLVGDGPVASFTLVGGHGSQHTYVLKQSPGTLGADLLVDGITRISNYAGKTASGGARVSFGTHNGDLGHDYLQFVGWGTPSFPGCMPGMSCCGDGVRDLGTAEECDTGSEPGNVICSPTCNVIDFLPVQPPAQPIPISMPTLRPDRTLGAGRHTLAGNAHTFAVAHMERAPSPPGVRLQILTNTGQRRVNVLVNDGPALLESNPVVAPLPGERYAVAWTDFGTDGPDNKHGDELGVALRLVDSHSAAPADLQHANTTVSFSQHDPDILWTGREIVVAWVDDSNAQTGPDLRYRIFDQDLAPQTAEQPLATGPEAEADVALSKLGSSWAAAWRAGKDGLETIHVKTGTTEWTVGPFLPGPANDKPGLAEIDATHLLLVYTEGTDPAGTGVANVGALRAALLDTAAPGLVPGLAVYPFAPGTATLGQSHPAAVRAGNNWFVAWRTEALPGDALAEEIWLKPVKLSTAHGLLDLSAIESPLPRDPDHLKGDQRHVSLAELAAPDAQQTMLLSAWDDLGTTFGPTEGQGDIVAQVVPLPLLPSTPTCSGDLNTSAENCGACGHSCLGGTCQAGQCQPFAWVTGLNTPMGVVVVGSDVYVVEGPILDPPPPGSLPDGTLIRIGPDGKKTVLETGLRDDGASALWFDQTTNRLMWIGFSGWRVATRPLEAPLNSATTLFSNHLKFPFGIVSNADTIFLSNWGDFPEEHTIDTVERRPRSNLTQFDKFILTTNVPPEVRPFHASHFDIDDTYIYWGESQTFRVVRRPLSVPFSAGPSTEVLVDLPANGRGLAVDKSTLFMTTYGQNDASPPGMVFRAANQPGAIPVKIATIPGNLEDVAVDAKALYIAGRTTGTIWKLAR